MKTVLTAVLLAVGGSMAHAQQTPDLPITAEWREKILDGVAQRYDSLYVFADRGQRIRKELTTKSVRVRYADCVTASCLANRLTTDLQAWSTDRHLKLVFSVTPRPMNSVQDTNAVKQREQENMRRRNYGFHNVERLHGNIGLLEIGRFDPAADAAPTAAAAMTFLANTDALIIDLRHNGGGRADMVAYLMSYFVSEQTHLSTMKRRTRDDDVQFWTAASVSAPRYLGKPVYVLTAKHTFSAAEGLTFDLRHFAGATVVGERTRGGANPGSFQQIDDHFAVFVPTGEMFNEKVHTNWEGTGIAPDVEVPAAEAMRAAHVDALRKLIQKKSTDARVTMWQQALEELDVKVQAGTK
jgi:retinol-binding protein 3